MAEIVVGELMKLLDKEIQLQKRGGEVVRWIENELEMLIPQMEMIEAEAGHSKKIDDLTASIREVICRAEDLAETRTKWVMQIRAPSTYKKPILSFKIWKITRKLHAIKDEIASDRDKLTKSVKEAAAELHSPRGREQSIPPYLRRCIQYFQLFPPGFHVPARRLIVLWVAEGLVHSKKYDDQSVEQIAERYLNEVINLGVLDVKRKRSGKVKSCVINVGRRDALLGEPSSVDKTNFLKDDRDGLIRRLVDDNGSEGASFIQIYGNQTIFQSVSKYRKVISFMSFNTREGSKPGEDIGNFLRKCIFDGCFIWLRVLDLERVFRPKLPMMLGELFCLKYLGLRWTYLEQLPDSVNKLYNLQVLDVKHTYITVLPRSIWRMQYLRHLYLSEAYCTRFPHPPSRITLTALQTLWGAFVDEDTCVKQGLDRLLNIRKLGLSCRRTKPSKNADQMSNQLKAIDNWISNLKLLESLTLKSRDERGNADHLHLTSLEGNKNLSTVYLLGKLKPSILCELPVTLTDITLSGSALDFDPMPFLGRLFNLVTVRLLGHSVLDSKMHCPRRGFPRLKLLWIWKQENLVEFTAEEESLLYLEELEIRSCNKLENLPGQLQHSKLIIKLTDMPPDFLLKTEDKYVKVEHTEEQFILKPKSVQESNGKQVLIE